MEMEEKIEICKIVTLAILSDAKITDAEHEFLQNLMSRWGLNDADRAEVLRCNMGDDPRDLLWTLTAGEGVDELLSELVQVVAVDGEIAVQERDLLNQVGDALDVDREQMDMLINSVKP